MNIMLIDDDEAIRDMLQDIIEDYELGTVVASLPSAATLTTTELVARHIDLLIIDMLMPDCDGIDSVRRFHDFPGKIIMISQVDSKDLIGKAYESGVYSYITKPLNRNEIVSVLRSVEEYIRLERFAHTLQNTLQTTLNPAVAVAPAKEVTPQQKAPRCSRSSVSPEQRATTTCSRSSPTCRRITRAPPSPRSRRSSPQLRRNTPPRTSRRRPRPSSSACAARCSRPWSARPRWASSTTRTPSSRSTRLLLRLCRGLQHHAHDPAEREAADLQGPHQHQEIHPGALRRLA